MTKSTYILLLCLIPLLCISSKCVRNHSPNLTKIGVYALSVPEPSGLAIDPDKQHLWMVSDRKSKIFKTNLKGEVVLEIDIKAHDYEGIAISPSGQHLFVLDEEKNKIHGFDLEGNKIFEYKVPIKSSKNSGTEGLDLLKDGKTFVVVNEKDPRTLMVVDTNHVVQMQKEISSLNDLSAVSYHEPLNEYWILSDEDEKLLRMNANFEIVADYRMDIIQMEGLAIDHEAHRIYIVSDQEEELHIFEYK